MGGFVSHDGLVSEYLKNYWRSDFTQPSSSIINHCTAHCRNFNRVPHNPSWRPMLPMSCFVKENAKRVALSRFWFNLAVQHTMSIGREQNGTYADTQPRLNKTVDGASIAFFAIQNDNLFQRRCAVFCLLLSGFQALVCPDFN